MSTEGWQALRSTNSGILVESAHHIGKTFQNNLNDPARTAMTWDIGFQANTVIGLSQVNNTQFSLPVGYFLIFLHLNVFSPTSAKLQFKVSYDLNGLPQPETSFSAILIATDDAHTNKFLHVDINTPGTTLELFGEQSGAGGTIETTFGQLVILRLSNFITP